MLKGVDFVLYSIEIIDKQCNIFFWQSSIFKFYSTLLIFCLLFYGQDFGPFELLQETKRPSKEMQVTIARQLGLEPTTVGNFFMNARRRSMDKWREEVDDIEDQDLEQDDQNANIKYEVYECQDGGMTDPNGAYQDYDGGMGGLGGAGDGSAYHSMTVVPGPVHNAHQLQFPPTCT